MGLSANAFGTQRRTGPPRSHSSWKNPNLSSSAYELTSDIGSKPNDFARSSQNGQPVAGSKCHRTISRTWASSFSRAARAATSETEGAAIEDIDEESYSRPVSRTKAR